MGKTKNKKAKKSSVAKSPVRVASASVHKNRARVGEPKRVYLKEQKSLSRVRAVILTVIALAMMAVALAFLTAVFAKPDVIIELKIKSIAADYYENYFYEKILDNTPSNKTMSEVMGKYLDTGFSTVSLRQLMLFDSRRHADAEAEIYKYCDPDETYVLFYPEEPFGAKDYRVEYKYACIF